MAGQACYQSEGVKFIHPLFSLQMEDLHLLKDLLRQKNFMCKADLKVRPFGQESQKISSISGSSTSDFYKIIENFHCDFKADSNQNNHLSGRHVADESDYKWSRNSQGYINVSTGESRLCYKSTEICSGSRVGNRLSQNDINTTTWKKNETETSKVHFKP